MKRMLDNRARVALLATLAASACGRGNDVHAMNVEGIASPLFVYDSALWPDPENIPVCWEQAGFAEEKAWAQDAVEQSWEKYSNVDFTGWGICPATPTGGLRIQWRDQRGASYLGTEGIDEPHGVQLNTWASQDCVADGSQDRETCVRGTAVHELGHALAFDHEQNRLDNPYDQSDPMGECLADDSISGQVEIGDWDKDSVLNYCSEVRNGAGTLSELDRAGVQMYYGTRKETQFGYDQGYRASRHPRMLADVNADGLQDVIGFANDGVHVARARSGRFLPPEDAFRAQSLWVAAYGYTAGGWRVENHPRMMADVNNDRRADVIGFANDGVYVSLSTGTSFGASTRWVAAYGYNAGGWRVAQHPRMMADVNADNRADVIGFANDGVYVSLANAAGTAFGASTRWIQQFGQDQGWTTTTHIRMMIDVNNDRRADIVGFGNGGVYVSLARTNNTFAARVLWVNNYGANADAGGWTLPNNPRFVARVNSDALPDIVGFGNSHVYVSINNNGSFAAPVVWARNRFGTAAAAGGWSASNHIRTVADVSGDGRADIVGFSDLNVIVATAGAASFGTPMGWAVGYDVADGWRVTENPRMLGQVDAIAGADIVGFGNDGLHTTSLGIHIDQNPD